MESELMSLRTAFLSGQVKLIRRGECNHCTDCCRVEEFKVPNLWRSGKCVYLRGNECTVWGTDKRPEVCKNFPEGWENYILDKFKKGVPLDFKPLLPNCSFWFEVVT